MLLTTVLAAYAYTLMEKTNVIGVGIGYKQRGGKRSHTPCLTVLVKQKMPMRALNRQDIIPMRIQGYQTDVVESGIIRAYEQVLRLRPAQPGISIGNFRVTAGTFGALVYDQKSKQPLILSNNHVLANATNGRDRRAIIGDPIVQPGTYDGGMPPEDTIGRLLRYVPIEASALPEAQQAASGLLAPGFSGRLEQSGNGIKSNVVDCALAEPLQPDLVDPEVLGLGEPREPIEPELDMKVLKSGRTTGITEGGVLLKDVVLRVDFGDVGIAVFSDQVVSNIESGPGDSGSLIMDRGNRPVGLLFAGGNGLTVFNRISNVTRALGVSFGR